MKILLGLLALLNFLIVPAVLLAQIPNNGFEDWADGAPMDWFTNNIPSFATPITQSATAHSNSSALRGEVVSTLSGAIAPIIQSGADAAGFAVSQRHASVTGYYQFAPVSGDRFGMNVVMYHNSTPVGTGAVVLSSTVSSYTQFTADINYLTGEVPDTCIIQILIVGPSTGGDFHVGSSMLVDDLSFTGTVTSVGEQALVNMPTKFSLAQNYPNPFNPSTTINYSLPVQSHVTLKIYDVLGQEVEILVDEMQGAGYRSVHWNAHEVPSGVYFYQLQTGTFKAVKKILVSK